MRNVWAVSGSQAYGLEIDSLDMVAPMRGFFGRTFDPRATGGVSRLAALVFFLLSILGASIVLFEPMAVRWAGAALLGMIGVAAGCLLIAVWPRPAAGLEEARRAAAESAASNAAWAVTAEDGSVLDCNVAYRFLAGAGEGEPPAPPQLAFPGEGPASALFRLSRAANEGREREEEFETESGQKLSAAVRTLDNGDTVWWFVPRLPDAGAPRGATEKRNPSALIRFADFFRNAPMGVALAGADGVILEVNSVFAGCIGIDIGSAPGRIDAYVLENERAATLELIAQASAGQSHVAPVEIHIGSEKESPTRSAQLFASRFMPGPEGEPRAILYVVDTSEQKALEARFAQAQKMQAVGQLAGGVAHDFNNLLQAIMGNCDLLLMRHAAGDPSFAEINEIRQNSVRAAGLVRQLLAFSRQQVLQPKVLALTDTLTELSQLLRRLIGEKVTLAVEHAQDLWPVCADEVQLSNAIMNLVVNARDAMLPQGGTVTIRTSNLPLPAPRPIGTGWIPAGDYVHIEVTDSGAGIARENLVKIFEPFFTTKPVGQGTGLGLAMVYGLVKQSDGFISVDSELGKGTTFQIYLPRHSASVKAPEVTEESERRRTRDVTGHDTILLVEDEDAVRSFAARALRLRGYTVIEASGGEPALEILRARSGEIDLLVTDVMMPNMDGPTLVQAARSMRPDLPVIFMSGYAEDAFRKDVEKAEELHFLAKPFGLKQLVAKVRDVLPNKPPVAPVNALNDTGT